MKTRDFQYVSQASGELVYSFYKSSACLRVAPMKFIRFTPFHHVQTGNQLLCEAQCALEHSYDIGLRRPIDDDFFCHFRLQSR